MMMNFLYFAVVCGVMQVAFASAEIFMPSNWEEFTLHHRTMENLFAAYKKLFNKSFASQDEEKIHFTNFIQRAKSIFDWNDLKNAKNRTFLKAINRFSDLTLEERRKFVMPETKVEPRKLRATNPVAKTLIGAGDSNVCDLRPFSTSVKDQASCGSCWAFGTIAAAEASHFLWSMTDAQGNPVPHFENNAWQLSEQVIMDCCGEKYDAAGCGGGGVSGPMQCAVDIGSLPSRISHPYQASSTNATCSFKATEAAAYVSSWHEPCANGDEACVKSYIGADSCTSFYTTALKTSIEVIDSFYDYASGVYSDPNCPNDIHNHAVAIVGWGTDQSSGKDYWIVRNSWGADWGEGGYIKMERGVNMCCVTCENLFFQ